MCAREMFNDGKLIDLVRTYPHLYDKRRSDFKDNLKKENSWREIAQLSRCSVEDAMARWKHLREKYLRLGKKLLNGSGAPNPETEWDLYSSLKWLDAYIARRRTKTIWNIVPKKTEQETEGTPQFEDPLAAPRFIVNQSGEESLLEHCDQPVSVLHLNVESPYGWEDKVLSRCSGPQGPSSTSSSIDTVPASSHLELKQEADKIVTEMQSIAGSMKEMMESVQKRKTTGNPTKEDLFGQQVAEFLKGCTNPAKKKKFMKDVFCMMLDDEEFD